MPVMGPVLVLIKCVFYGKFYVSSDKYVTIVVKTKCVNSGNMSNKLNFITNYTKFITTDTHFIKIHIYLTIFDILDETVLQQDLRISPSLYNIWYLF